MAGIAQLCFMFPIDATFDEVTSAVARHFGGEPLNLSTGEPDTPPLRDATAVFTGTSQMTVSTGTNASTSAPTLDVDTEGLPWDARIHSDSKAKTEDGKWRMRRGAATRADLSAIKAELLARIGGAPAAQAAQASSAAPQDSDEFRKARIEYARSKAFASAGPQPCNDETFNRLTRGEIVTGATQYVLDWFKEWQVAFNTAYGEYTGTQVVHMSTQAISSDAAPGVVQMSGTPPANLGQVAQQLAATLPATPAATVAMPGDKPQTTFLGNDASVLSGDDFASFVGWQAMQTNQGKLSVQQLQGVFAQLGIEHLGALAQQPAMIPAVKALLAAQGVV
jgi:hypothetical protein